MAHEFKVREIAVQAGLSEATVDRVLHRRGGVRADTVRLVEQAIADLDRQRTQLRLGGRTFMVDVVVQAPARFSSAVRAALEAELPSLAPAVVRSRFSFRESGPVAELVAVLDRIGRRGSHGVVLKAPDAPEVTAAVQRLGRTGIPVVTLVTDLPGSGRLAYVGMDNRAAGATAAYLVGQWLGDRPGNVLVTVSSSAFRGEEEREMGFRAAMRSAQPLRALVEVTGSEGLDSAQRDLVLDGAGPRPRAWPRSTPSAAATSPPSAPSTPSAGAAPSSSPTTWTRTTCACCTPAGCPRCCTTTSAGTSGKPAG